MAACSLAWMPLCLSLMVSYNLRAATSSPEGRQEMREETGLGCSEVPGWALSSQVFLRERCVQLLLRAHECNTGYSTGNSTTKPGRGS